MNSNQVVSRRDVLQAGAVGMAALSLDQLAWAKDDKVDKGWIDPHSHIWTRDVKSYPLAQGQTVEDLDPASFTAEELIQVSQSAGVSRVVLIQHHIYHGWDNTYLTDSAAKYPQRFRVVGMVDDTRSSPEVEMRELLKKRVTGFRITSWIRGSDKWLDGPGMRSMWKCAADTRQAMCCLIDAQDLPAVDAMCRKHPETPVVIDHFARIGVDGKIREEEVTQLCDLSKHKNVNVKVSAYYALGKKEPPYLDLAPMIRRVYEAFGPQRLMWASDSPYQLVGEHTYEASLSLVRDKLDFLSESDRNWLLRDTALRVYFFDKT